MFARLMNRTALPVLDTVLRFTEARHRVLTENIANADTPDYRTKQLDPKGFQRALRAAVDRRGADGSAPLRLEGTKQFRMDAAGRLAVSPTEEPVENVLFHDGTNQRIERQMAYLSENAMTHQVAAELLRGKYEALLTAIRGRG